MEEISNKQGCLLSGRMGRDDRILPETRWLAVCILPFLVAAFLLLYVWPQHTDTLFAWTITPAMTPLLLAAAYGGGMYFFTRAALAKRWHLVKVGFLPVMTFAALLLIATLLHWDRFHHRQLAFFTWVALYCTTPFLVCAVWVRNRTTDPGTAEPNDVIIPPVIRLCIGAFGVSVLAGSLLLFLQPALLIPLWPWMLTPLTARVVGAIYALPAVVGVGIAREPRWSVARIVLEAQACSIVLILIATARAWSDFDHASLSTWLFVGGLSLLLVALAALYVSMELHRRNAVERGFS